MLLKKAMRYYRLWIYTCNAVLLVSVVGFMCVAGHVISDSRRSLIPGIKLYHPTFIYAYLALATQSSILQVIGCFGALRLNERLLNIYWLLLLGLLCGDAIIGLVWIFRFDRICSDLRPSLKQRLAAEYGVDTAFTDLWNSLQRDSQCCGVERPEDFNSTVWYDMQIKALQGVSLKGLLIPESCCYPSRKSSFRRDADMRSTSIAAVNESESHVLEQHSRTQDGVSESATKSVPLPAGTFLWNTSTLSDIYTTGCEEKLLFWLRQNADVLFVIGYCVIAFLKLCFLGILRYEIREMIQKIKVLQGETRQPFPELAQALGLSGMNSPPTPNADHHHHHAKPSVTTVVSDSLQNTPLHHAKLNHLNDGTDSDTNSNCALIIDKPGSNGNNNEIHELQELKHIARQTQI